MHADPEAALLVLHQVDVVVAGADRAELLLGELRELALRLEVGLANSVEHGMIGALLRRHAHAERDPADDLAHHGLDLDFGRLQIRPHGLVAAPDVVADARRRDVPLVGDAAADRLAVARVVVGAEDAELRVAGRHAPLQLLEAPLIDAAERLDPTHGRLPVLSRTKAEAGRRRGPTSAVPQRVRSSRRAGRRSRCARRSRCPSSSSCTARPEPARIRCSRSSSRRSASSCRLPAPRRWSMRSIPHVAFGSVVSTCTVESGSTKSTRGSAVMLSSAPARNVRGIALRGVRVDEADGEPQSARVLARDRGRIRVVVQDDDVAGRSGAPCRRGGNEQDREECDDGKKRRRMQWPPWFGGRRVGDRRRSSLLLPGSRLLLFTTR